MQFPKFICSDLEVTVKISMDPESMRNINRELGEILHSPGIEPRNFEALCCLNDEIECVLRRLDEMDKR